MAGIVFRFSDIGIRVSPRQSVGGGKSIQKRVGTRFLLLKTAALRGKLTSGDPFEDTGVAGGHLVGGLSSAVRDREECPEEDHVTKHRSFLHVRGAKKFVRCLSVLPLGPLFFSRNFTGQTLLPGQAEGPGLSSSLCCLCRN